MTEVKKEAATPATGGKAATEGNQSPQPPKSTGTNIPGSPPSDHASAAGATQPSTTPAAAVASDAATGKTDEALTQKAKDVDDDEFEKALAEDDVTEDPSEAELDAFDPIIASAGDETQTAEVKRVLDKLAHLSLDTIQAGSPDSYNLFGYAGVLISLGDIRMLSRAYRKAHK